MKYIRLSFLFLFFLPCKSFCQPQKLYFNPATATGLPQSRIFEEIKYIPLETKRESLFGKISRLIVTGKYFIVFDSDTNAVYFFLKNGKFVKKFKFRGYDIKTILYDERKDALLIAGLNKNYNPSEKSVQAMIDDPVNNNSVKHTKAVYYYLSQEREGQKQVVKNFDLALANPFPFCKDQWVYSYIYANKSWPDTQDSELKISDGHRIVRSYFPYNRKTSSIFYSKPQNISFSKTRDSSVLLFTRPFNYSIYELTPDTVRELYTLVLPATNTIPKVFFTEKFQSQSSLEDFKMKNSGLAWGINNVIDLNRYLFFSLNIFRNFRNKNFLYDKKNHLFLNQNKITPDSVNNYLPVMGFGIQAFDKNYLYSSVSSATMFQNKRLNENRNLKYDPVINKYFKECSAEDNPVIIALKPGN